MHLHRTLFHVEQLPTGSPGQLLQSGCCQHLAAQHSQEFKEPLIVLFIKFCSDIVHQKNRGDAGAIQQVLRLGQTQRERAYFTLSAR